MKNYSKYRDYWDWYDNGPGSENWKRKVRRQADTLRKKFPSVKGFPFYKEEKEKHLEDELFEI